MTFRTFRQSNPPNPKETRFERHRHQTLKINNWPIIANYQLIDWRKFQLQLIDWRKFQLQ